jgi:Ca-activated chloride channel homolog
MSFASPLWLLALLVIPLALLAQWRWRRRARGYAVRFTAVDSLQQALGGTSGRWQRHLPLAAAMLALAALVLALGRPQVLRRVPIGNASLMLVLDHSGSMAANDVAPSRIQAAISAGNTFIDQLPGSARVGLVAFGSTPDAVQQPTTNHTVTRQLLDGQVANGGTDTGPALQLALQLLHGSVKGHAPSAIVLLSDGAANLGISPVTVAQQAKQDHIPIYTVALGTPEGVLQEGPFVEPVPPDPQLMAQIASTSGGKAFDAKTADELSSIYKTLGSKLGSLKRERDITVYVVIIGAALLLVAAGASVRTSVRLP